MDFGAVHFADWLATNRKWENNVGSDVTVGGDMAYVLRRDHLTRKRRERRVIPHTTFTHSTRLTDSLWSATHTHKHTQRQKESARAQQPKDENGEEEEEVEDDHGTNSRGHVGRIMFIGTINGTVYDTISAISTITEEPDEAPPQHCLHYDSLLLCGVGSRIDWITLSQVVQQQQFFSFRTIPCGSAGQQQQRR